MHADPASTGVPQFANFVDMKRLGLGLAVAVVLIAPTGVSAKAFKNCSELNKKYPTGVAKSVAAAATQKKMPLVSSSIYKLNIKMDRDKDGTVCEK